MYCKCVDSIFKKGKKMNSWMEGYSSDVEYTTSYYREVDPSFLNLCLVMAGVEPIDTSEEFSYCELGCGHGLTILSLATNYPNGVFYAVDYNPSHIAQARTTAKKAGLDNIYFFEKSFQELIDAPSLLPMVDYMVFHGIYTWVNEMNRANLVELCHRYIKSGGVVYNSYNAKPGWLYDEPIQKLILGLSKEYRGDSIAQIKEVTKTLESLQGIEHGYFKTNAISIKKRIKKIKNSNPNYTVHEYLHENWRAFYFPEVCEEMERAKLTYLSQANPAEAYSEPLLPLSLKERLRDIHDNKNRELLKDFTVNRIFRKDIYVRGMRRALEEDEKLLWFLDKEWILLTIEEIKTFEFELSTGKATGNAPLYRTIVNLLKKEPLSTKRLQEITEIELSIIVQSLILLYSEKMIAQYQKRESPKAIVLNRILTQNATARASQYIILPYANIMLSLDSVSSIFMDGLYKGVVQKDALVAYVYNRLTLKKLSIISEDKQVQGEKMKKALYLIEKRLRETFLPILKQTGGI